MRLIDADNFIGFIKELKEAGAEHVSFDDLMKFINNQPTAYDVDKVVEELEELRDFKTSQLNILKYGLVQMSINIVRSGGIE